MAINKKNKRKVEIDGKSYLWWVYNEIDQTTFDGLQVRIVSEDQSHFLLYGLEQPKSSRKLVLALRDYCKMVHLSFPPKFESNDGILSSSGIRQLVRWSKQNNHQIEYALHRDRNEFKPIEMQNLLEEILQEIK